MKRDPNNYWEQLERLEKLIRASELKAAIILSFHSLIIGLFFDNLGMLESNFGRSIIFISLVSGWLLLGTISLYFALKCFIPRLEVNFDKNVFFFIDAAHKYGSIDEFTKKLIKVCDDQEELFKQLGEQIFIESMIIDEKFKNVQRSIKFLGLSFVFVVLLLGFWLFSII